MYVDKELLILTALSVIVISLIVPLPTVQVSALKSSDCPKYCDGCCTSLPKPKNATGLGNLASPPPTSTTGNIPSSSSDTQKTMQNNGNGPTPPKCPDKGLIPPDCTMKPTFPNSSLAFR
jgi:hypothetical protein